MLGIDNRGPISSFVPLGQVSKVQRRRKGGHPLKSSGQYLNRTAWKSRGLRNYDQLTLEPTLSITWIEGTKIFATATESTNSSDSLGHGQEQFSDSDDLTPVRWQKDTGFRCDQAPLLKALETRCEPLQNFTSAQHPALQKKYPFNNYLR